MSEQWIDRDRRLGSRPGRALRMRCLALAAAVLAVALVAVPAATAADAGITRATLVRTLNDKGDLSGRWTMRLTESGTRYRISRGAGQYVASGRIREISGNRVAFTDTGGPGACQGAGRYVVVLKGSSFTFRALADPCTARKTVLAGTWKLVATS